VQTVKTSVVVVLLLAVCYGAFVALNAPEPELPPELKQWAAEDGEFETLVDIDMGTSPASLPTVAMPNSPGSNLPSIDNSLQPTLLPPATINAANGLAHSSGPSGIAENNSNSANLLPESNSTESLVSSIQPNALPVAAVNPGSEFPSIPVASDKPASGSMAKQPENSPKFTVAGNVNEIPAGPLLPQSAVTTSQDSSATRSTANALPVFQDARKASLKAAADGKLGEALAGLSKHYNDPVLTSEEHADLLDILDALAREVIFSQRHLLMPAYTTTASDSVASVAAKHQITPELLNQINQLGSAQALLQGQKLKVIEGPFRGEVNLSRQELTLFVGDMYACRFPFSIGNDPAPKAGSYEVADKRKDRTYYGAGGKAIAANDPLNPYGGFWIDLGHGMCVHGSPEMSSSELNAAGCISLSPIDASDVYYMLTQGSRIDIR
jgi:LysM repeat protein